MHSLKLSAILLWHRPISENYAIYELNTTTTNEYFSTYSLVVLQRSMQEQ